MIQGSGMPSILFDTGAQGRILLSNLKALEIDPLSIDLVFISHGHFDLLQDLELICPTHCTRYKKELERLYPNRYVEGGVGRTITINHSIQRSIG